MGWITGLWPMPVAVAGLVIAAAVVGVSGVRLTRVVDQLADRTGIGEAVAGAVLLGGATSLAGLVVSVVAAASGNASLAVSNSIGGIAAQTAFIVVADLVYRRANLEHAAASVTNIFNSLLMMMLLGVVVLGATAPPVTLAGIHPATVLLIVAYGYGLALSRRVTSEPMWRPTETSETRTDQPDQHPPQASGASLGLRFGILAVVVATAGYLVARSGISVAEASGLSGTFVGAFMTSVVTSLPELVTAIAAVRAGALTLAVGGIVGGNTFDMLFIATADIVYQRGSIYASMTQADLFLVGWTMLLVGTVTAGLVRRQRHGIGFEGYAVLALYLAGLGTISLLG